MDAYKTAARIEQEGELHLSDLPFHTGDEVEVILLRRDLTQTLENPYPLRGLPIHYDNPTEPVAEGDREVRREYSSEELVRGITQKNRHEETDFGPPVGREIL
jgi:hypothetical protein